MLSNAVTHQHVCSWHTMLWRYMFVFELVGSTNTCGWISFHQHMQRGSYLFDSYVHRHWSDSRYGVHVYSYEHLHVQRCNVECKRVFHCLCSRYDSVSCMRATNTLSFFRAHAVTFL